MIIVDDQYMARQLFELYIKSSGRYQLAGTASSGQQALSLVQAVSADLILMDILMGKTVWKQQPGSKLSVPGSGSLLLPLWQKPPG